LKPLKVYNLLLLRFGPQGWWPVTPAGGNAPVYRPGKPKPENEEQRQEIAFGAILTQNTAWGNVEKAFFALHSAGIRDAAGLLGTKPDFLRKLIRPSGYYVQKEKKLRGFCRYLCENYPAGLGDWLKKPLKPLRQELLSLWGVGPETADSILLYAGGRPVFVVDAYTLRLAERLGWPSGSYEKTQDFMAGNLPRSVKIYNEFHALIVRLAKERCRKKPDCRLCPLAKGCKARFAVV